MQSYFRISRVSEASNVSFRVSVVRIMGSKKTAVVVTVRAGPDFRPHQLKTEAVLT